MDIGLGCAVPEFNAQATQGKTIRASDLLDTQWVLYFYPKDSTPGCTNEGEDFRELFPQFQAANTQILGVSRDSLSSHERFKAKHAFPFELISDPEQTLCQLFGVIKPKKLYGKEYIGIERSTFLIDAAGVLRHEWRAVKVKGHAAAVLHAAQNLQSVLG